MIKIEVRNIRVRSLSVDFNEITWQVANTAEDVLDYSFQILRSEAAAGPFDVLSPEMDDQYIFVDNSLKNANLFRQYHYIIRVRHKPSDETRDFGPVSKAPDADLVAVELRRHMNLLLREFAGRRCWVFPVRTMGQRCTSCWNATLNKRTKSGCKSCFDTGFVRGYHRPIEAWVQIDPVADNEQPANVGRLQQQSSTARMSYFPPLKPDDLLIEPENLRWKIRTVTTTQQGRAIITQEMQIHLLPTSDIEYEIPLILGETTDSSGALRPIELSELFFNPSRNFTNPHTLGNDEEQGIDYPQVYQLYGSTYPEIKS